MSTRVLRQRWPARGRGGTDVLEPVRVALLDRPKERGGGGLAVSGVRRWREGGGRGGAKTGLQVCAG